MPKVEDRGSPWLASSRICSARNLLAAMDFLQPKEMPRPMTQHSNGTNGTNGTNGVSGSVPTPGKPDTTAPATPDFKPFAAENFKNIKPYRINRGVEGSPKEGQSVYLSRIPISPELHTRLKRVVRGGSDSSAPFDSVEDFVRHAAWEYLNAYEQHGNRQSWFRNVLWAIEHEARDRVEEQALRRQMDDDLGKAMREIAFLLRDGEAALPTILYHLEKWTLKYPAMPTTHDEKFWYHRWARTIIQNPNVIQALRRLENSEYADTECVRVLQQWVMLYKNTFAGSE